MTPNPDHPTTFNAENMLIFMLTLSEDPHKCVTAGVIMCLEGIVLRTTTPPHKEAGGCVCAFAEEREGEKQCFLMIKSSLPLISPFALQSFTYTTPTRGSLQPDACLSVFSMYELDVDTL